MGLLIHTNMFKEQGKRVKLKVAMPSAPVKNSPGIFAIIFFFPFHTEPEI